MNPQEVRELVALISWLQTFAQFIYVLFDGPEVLREGNEEEMGKLALNALENPKISRAILEVAQEVCYPATVTTPPDATNQDIWKAILHLSGTKGLVRALERPDTLPLCALTNLLKAAVTNPDLNKRRAYIERIMSLSKGVQKILMTVIERSKKTPRKISSSSSSSRSSRSARSSSERSNTGRSRSSPAVKGKKNAFDTAKSMLRSTTPVKRSRSVTPVKTGRFCGALPLSTGKLSSMSRISSKSSMSVDSNFQSPVCEEAASMENPSILSPAKEGQQQDQQQQQQLQLQQQQQQQPQKQPNQQQQLQSEQLNHREEDLTRPQCFSSSFQEKNSRDKKGSNGYLNPQMLTTVNASSAVDQRYQQTFTSPREAHELKNQAFVASTRQRVEAVALPIEATNLKSLLSPQSSCSQSNENLPLASTHSSEEETTQRNMHAANSGTNLSTRQPSQEKELILHKAVPPPQDEFISDHIEDYMSPMRGPTSPLSTLQSPMQIEAYVHELKDKNRSLELILQSYRQRESDLTQKMEESDGKLRKEMMKLEKRALQREEDLRSNYDSEVARLKKDLKKYREESENGQKAKRQLDDARDEIELMQHNQEMLAEARERLRMYKERLDELTDVRDALQREREAHNAAVEQCVKFENELGALRPLKRQLEDCKNRAIDSEVKLAECQNQLKLVERDVQTYEETKNMLMEEVKAQKQEADELRTRMKAGENADMGPSIGEGISELNPELKEEIVRLRNENNQLRIFANKRKDDSVQKLEEDFDDSIRLADRYKNEYLQTKIYLADTETKLTNTQNELRNTQDELTKTREESGRYKDEADKNKNDYLQTRDNLTETETKLSNTQGDLRDTQEESKRYKDEADRYKHEYLQTRDDLNETKAELRNTEEESKRLQEDLSKTKNTLQDTKSELSESKYTVRSLIDKVNHWTEEATRRNDECVVAKRDLKKSESELKIVQEEVAELTEKVNYWTEEAGRKKEECLQANRNIIETQSKLTNEQENSDRLTQEVTYWKQETSRSKDECLQTQRKLAHSELETKEAQRNVTQLKSDVEKWKSNAEDAESRMDIIEGKLKESLLDLEHLEKDLKDAEEHKAQLKTEIAHWQQTTEDTESISKRRLELIEKTQKSFEETKSKLERSEESKAELREALSSVETELKKTGAELGAVKEELSTSKQKLKESQDSLASARVLESSLKSDIASLKKIQANVQNQLEEERRLKQETVEESQRALEATREVLHAKSKKDLAELQSNMNRLLEDERVAYRQKAEQAAADAREIEQKWRSKYLELQERSGSSLTASRQEAQERIDAVESECRSQIDKVKRQAEESRAALLEKGTAMIEEAKKKAKKDFQALHEKSVRTESKLQKTLQEKDELESQYRSNITTMKQKLQFATDKINVLNDDADELQQNIRSLEREKFKVEEENERYRRQLGGRYGADGKIQAQLDKLQKEYNEILEENRNLKKKTYSGLSDPLSTTTTTEDSTSQESSLSSYSRGAVSSSALSQLREEYEATIEGLNDEKRELVMRNSAAITEVQKAEQTAWERDQEVNRLKNQITSLKLELQRMEHKRQQSSGGENGGVKSHVSLNENYRPPSARKVLTPSNKYTNDANVFSFSDQKDDPYVLNVNDATPKSQTQTQLQARPKSSIVECTKVSGTEVDGQSDCQQS